MIGLPVGHRTPIKPAVAYALGALGLAYLILTGIVGGPQLVCDLTTRQEYAEAATLRAEAPRCTFLLVAYHCVVDYAPPGSSASRRLVYVMPPDAAPFPNGAHLITPSGGPGPVTTREGVRSAWGRLGMTLLGGLVSLGLLHLAFKAARGETLAAEYRGLIYDPDG